jgi:hypothetical protein
MQILFDKISVDVAKKLIAVVDPNSTAKLVEVKNTSTNTRKLSANAHAAYRKYWQSNDAAILSVEDAFVAGHIAAARQLA